MLPPEDGQLLHSQSDESGQALLSELKQEEHGRKSALLCTGLSTLWTEHSERMTMRTWAQAVRIPDDIRRQMGRWRPSADEGYEQAARINVLRAQKVIAEFIRGSLGKADPFDESAVLQLAYKKMVDMGMPEEVQEEQLSALSSYHMPNEGAEQPRMPIWRTQGIVQFREPGSVLPGDVTDVEEASEAETEITDDLFS